MNTSSDCMNRIVRLCKGILSVRCHRIEFPDLSIANTICLLFLAIALVACSDHSDQGQQVVLSQGQQVVLSDATGSRTLVYQYGKGFIPQATVDDVPLLVHSMQLALSDAIQEKDTLTAKALQTAMNERNYRALERTIVEFRFRQIQKSIK